MQDSDALGSAGILRGLRFRRDARRYNLRLGIDRLNPLVKRNACISVGNPVERVLPENTAEPGALTLQRPLPDGPEESRAAPHLKGGELGAEVRKC